MGLVLAPAGAALYPTRGRNVELFVCGVADGVDIWTFHGKALRTIGPVVTIFRAHRGGLAAVNYTASTGSFAIGKSAPFHVATTTIRGIVSHQFSSFPWFCVEGFGDL